MKSDSLKTITVLVILVVSAAFIFYACKKALSSSNINYYQVDAETDVKSPKVINSPDISDIPVSIFHCIDKEGSQFSIQMIASSGGFAGLPSSVLENIQSCSFIKGNSEITKVGWYWNKVDPVIIVCLGNLYNDPASKYPVLKKWNSNSPTFWYGINSGRKPVLVKIVNILQKYSETCSVNVAPDVSEDGIFIQEGSIVGWSFQNARPHSYMQTGFGEGFIKADKTLTQLIDDYCSVKIADTIKQIIESNQPDYVKFQRICAMAGDWAGTHGSLDGFPDAALLLNTAGNLAESCMKTGNAKIVADTLSPKFLEALGSDDIISISSYADISEYGYGIAIRKLLDIQAYRKQSGIHLDKIAKIILNTYLNWINEQLNSTNPRDAVDIYNSAVQNCPESPELKISGIEMFIKLDMFQEAESILNGTVFPPSYADNIRKYRNLIKDHRNLQNIITIKFVPGSPQIPVSASVNGYSGQQFILDTGATYVTIPYATAENAGVDYASGRVRIVATAAGNVKAREVVLHSITLNGKTVYDITALVMDLPSHPNKGLLGLSFLDKFHVELNSREGIVTLRPRE